MSNQQNEKIIKNFKRRVASTRRQLHEFIKAMCAEANGGEVKDILLGKGMTPCVAREWGNQYRIRDYFLKRAILRKYRKETSSFGKRFQNYRRIIWSTIRKGRHLEFHATKGLRSYRVFASEILIA